MTYKEFKDWCNDRACDGMWHFHTFLACRDVIDTMESTIFFRRKKIWKKLEPEVMATIVEPTNSRIEERLERMKKYHGSNDSES